MRASSPSVDQRRETPVPAAFVLCAVLQRACSCRAGRHRRMCGQHRASRGGGGGGTGRGWGWCRQGHIPRCEEGSDSAQARTQLGTARRGAPTSVARPPHGAAAPPGDQAARRATPGTSGHIAPAIEQGPIRGRQAHDPCYTRTARRRVGCWLLAVAFRAVVPLFFWFILGLFLLLAVTRCAGPGVVC